MKNIYFLILCGGGGERLWPISRRKRPKQFLAFLNGKSLLQDTVERIRLYSSKNKKIGIVTTKEQSSYVSKSIGGKIDFILEEPETRNTAPAILYSCLKLKELVNDAVVVFLPSDSFVEEKEKYSAYLDQVVEHAQNNEKIVTIGIMPTRPATGYGYIQANCDCAEKISAGKFYDVFKFHEKPNAEQAEKYMQQGNMFWNISVFAAKLSVFLKEFEICSPDIFCSLQSYLKHEINYQDIPSISIDYAVMEKSKNVVVLPAEFEWSDVGNLDVFLNLQARYSITKSPKIINIDSEGNLVRLKRKHSSKGKIVAFIGVHDLCVIEDGDVILVAKRSEVEKVKKVLGEIKKKSLEKFL